MRVAMTGGTAGIGAEAARRLVDAGADLVIGARGAAPAVPDGAMVEPLDLADLRSVEAFAERVAAGPPVDVLLLNAGVQDVSGRRSEQGFDLTFAVNHLAHLLVARRLASVLARGGRVVFTSSGTHDPEERTGIPAPRHADARLLAYPERDPERDAGARKAGQRAYSASKLCNLMTARELARRLQPSRPDVAVIAFDPGFTPGTGLARGYSPVLAFAFRHILPLVVRGPRVSTAPVSGAWLAELASNPVYAAARGEYYSVRARRLVPARPSALARDDDACARLWEESVALLDSWRA